MKRAVEIIVAESAGFCFGVSRAIDTVYKNLEIIPMVTYGPIIHNQSVVNDLEARGVEVIDDFEKADGRTVIIRSHGVGPEIYKNMDKKGIFYIDCTCPYVKKIHQIADNCRKEGRVLIIAGDRSHPEVEGIRGYGGGKVIVLANGQDAERARLSREVKYTLVSQTTLQKVTFDEIKAALDKKELDIEIFNTICSATRTRQAEADMLSKKVDKMIVLGDAKSSNSAKLYKICKDNCKNTYFIETIDKLQLNIFDTNDKIGVTAGASTSPVILKEAVKRMSELEAGIAFKNEDMNSQLVNEANETDESEDKSEETKRDQSFQEMLDESFVTLHTGDIVKGTVIQVANGEVSVNLGFKSDGTIPRGEFSENSAIDPADVVKPGDEIEVFVVKVSDVEGDVTLSRKKLEMQKGYADLEEAFNNKTPIKGKVADVVKGGIIAIIGGVRVFVPSSHASNHYVHDLSVFKGKEMNFHVIEYDRPKRRIVASRKELAAAEELELKEKVFGDLNVGDHIDGTVSRIVDFGAFVDLGGVDGLIHISELSWGRVKKVSDVLSEGDKVTVVVLDINKDKGKISLSLKNEGNDPWNNIAEQFPVGSIVEGKVVRLVPFGAFVELKEGVDGLIHISQIAKKHVVKPEDELSIGEIVQVKVVEVDQENKKISLSKKAVASDSDNDMEYVTDEEAVDEQVPEAVAVDEEVKTADAADAEAILEAEESEESAEEDN